MISPGGREAWLTSFVTRAHAQIASESRRLGRHVARSGTGELRGGIAGKNSCQRTGDSSGVAGVDAGGEIGRVERVDFVRGCEIREE